MDRVKLTSCESQRRGFLQVAQRVDSLVLPQMAQVLSQCAGERHVGLIAR